MSTAAKAEAVHQIFEAISHRYDAANLRITFGMETRWKNRLVSEILSRVGAGDAVLDVCCGTGDIALSLAARNPALRVTGLDFSAAMLQAAGKKGAGLSNVTWREGDAMALPFPDGSFSAASISFGLRNTADYARVLRELRRVVKPGGHIFCMDSFVPESRLVLPFYELYFRLLMPFLGGGIRLRGAYLWLYRSTRDFLNKDQLLSLMRETGLGAARCKTYLFGACVLHIARRPPTGISPDFNQSAVTEGDKTQSLE